LLLIVSGTPILIYFIQGNYAKFKCVQPQPSPLQGENGDKNHQMWNFGDTYMQQVARSKTVEEYPSADYCRQAFEQGMLDIPEMVAGKIVIILENKYDQGQYVKVSEV
jgi:hypothetical protein